MSEKLYIPLSIVIAGIFIGAGFYMSGKHTASAPKTLEETKALTSGMRPVDQNDHLLGNPQARLILVEYSDTKCPFCKQFHSTMRQLMNQYGSSGDLAWVYRHFPVKELHSKAPKEAEALECAGEMGGNSKFWEYTNRIYELTPSNNELPQEELTNIATQVGLSSTEFNTCLSSGKYASKVEADTNNALDAGAQGTPYGILVDTSTGDTYPINGAYPYPTMKEIIDLLLKA